MEKAILYHSELYLPDDLTEREQLFCNIIREADRIEIFRTVAENSWETIYGYDQVGVLSSKISDEILAFFDRFELVDRSKCKTPADHFLAHIALVFGLTTSAAIERCVKQGYVNKLLNTNFSDSVSQRKFAHAKSKVKLYLSHAINLHEINPDSGNITDDKQSVFY